MPNKPTLINNTLTVNFAAKHDIRKQISAIEDIVCTKETSFIQPILLPIPDEFDPSAPRIIFNTTHGFTQLMVAQNSMSLIINYDPVYQHDFSLCEQYIGKHAHFLYKLVEKIVKQKACYTGLASVVRIGMKADHSEIISKIARQYSVSCDTKDLYDIDMKFTHVIEDKYFKNMQIQNYRIYISTPNKEGVPRYSLKSTAGNGIQLVLDFNDRLAFNESDNYYTSHSKCMTIIKESFKQMNSDISKMIK